MQQDSNQKQVNGIGWFFVITLVVHVALSVFVSLLVEKGLSIPVELQLVFSELTVLVPTLIYALKNNINFREDFGFKKIKVGTIFMAVLLALLISPAATLVNLLSQLFVPNTMVLASDDLLSGSNVLILFLSAVYGPFCEELCFRSAILKGYEKGAGFIKALLISSLFFGFTHLNVNQACYAILLGLFFSIINKASGSVYTSMIIHTCINGGNMLMLMASTALIDASGIEMDIAQAAETARGMKSYMYVMIAVYLVLAIAGLAIAIPCVIWMAKHEGKLEEFKCAFSKNENHKDGKVRVFFNVSAIVATLLSLFLIFGLDPLIAYFETCVK